MCFLFWGWSHRCVLVMGFDCGGCECFFLLLGGGGWLLGTNDIVFKLRGSCVLGQHYEKTGPPPFYFYFLWLRKCVVLNARFETLGFLLPLRLKCNLS